MFCNISCLDILLIWHTDVVEYRGNSVSGNGSPCATFCTKYVASSLLRQSLTSESHSSEVSEVKDSGRRDQKESSDEQLDRCWFCSSDSSSSNTAGRKKVLERKARSKCKDEIICSVIVKDHDVKNRMIEGLVRVI